MFFNSLFNNHSLFIVIMIHINDNYFEFQKNYTVHNRNKIKHTYSPS